MMAERDGLIRYGVAMWLFNVLTAALVVAFVAPATADSLPRLVVLGDSLTSGYGLPAEQAFPAQLQQTLQRNGVAVEVRNAGVSGDTTAGGLARLTWVLDDRPNFVVVQLGGNDALRGLDPKRTYANLDAILTRLRAAKIPVLLTGMRAPPNLGREFTAAFDAVFPRLARKHAVMLYPFFLDGVAANGALNQSDGIHPNARGVGVIVERIRPYIKKLIDGEY
jgi:acyl-CoA thioesterase-1